MNHNLKIGITGGLGLIGKALRKELTSPVVFVSRQDPNHVKANEHCLLGSFADDSIQVQFTKDLDVLIHAATAVGPRSEFDWQFIENDLVGTINLVRAFFKTNPHGHFIFLSSAGGLYDLEDPIAKTEESETNPKSLYGAIKLTIENFLESEHFSQGKVTILRPAPIYGDSFKKNQTVGLIDKLLKSTLRDSASDPVIIFDRLESARDYLHVDDLVHAIALAMNRTAGNRFEVYNIGSGVESSIDEVITLVNEICLEKARVEIRPVTHKATSLIVNSDKIFRELGWKSKISLREGVMKMYEDLKKRETI